MADLQTPAAGGAPTALTAPTVLIVERDTEYADTLAAAFARAGFSVRCAADGGAAFEEITWECPRLIVLDLDTPAVGGGRLLDVLRAQPATRSVPVLALATFSYQEAKEAIRAGADDCLIKPLPPDEVVAAARDLLERIADWAHITTSTTASLVSSPT
jgi:DNA-binding response OmpR family regulator